MLSSSMVGALAAALSLCAQIPADVVREVADSYNMPCHNMRRSAVIVLALADGLGHPELIAQRIQSPRAQTKQNKRVCERAASAGL